MPADDREAGRGGAPPAARAVPEYNFISSSHSLLVAIGRVTGLDFFFSQNYTRALRRLNPFGDVSIAAGPVRRGAAAAAADERAAESEGRGC